MVGSRSALKHFISQNIPDFQVPGCQVGTTEGPGSGSSWPSTCARNVLTEERGSANTEPMVMARSHLQSLNKRTGDEILHSLGGWIENQPQEQPAARMELGAGREDGDGRRLEGACWDQILWEADEEPRVVEDVGGHRASISGLGGAKSVFLL